MNSKTPAVSIIIPTYNRAEDLNRALKSILQQSFSNWEVLVIDNMSDDNTREIVSNLNEGRIRFFTNPNKGNIASSRNIGIEHALSELVAFLDSDDWWSPEKLEMSLNAFSADVDIVYHDLWAVKSDKKRFSELVGSTQVEMPVFKFLIEKGNVIPNSSVVVRTALLKQIGGLSEDRKLIAAEDYDCWVRLSQITNKFVFIPQVLGYYWVGSGASSNPERRLNNFKALRNLYFDQYVKVNKIAMPVWILYNEAMMHLKLGEYSESRSKFQAVLKQNIDLQLRLKGTLAFLVAGLRSVF